ncbi:ABC transporter substrate binding protein [Azorhizobium caulinodans ORS 571]|uniref:ABC transporter substrate binding protein n=1 Tax=Azorhizobium caulinodans (strain ATCC 43989 / DSM 5975 / JCM 20966 / LMG 6465 / NBRC 14845 / NCIMB 13405 / ORS 571) TaxID=438753 RepID=A8IQF4_AZOC5|nr:MULTISPECIES: ABC transporter substrate-binding protein [Azorhizobium]TDT87689.1 peptide/nickel transport system substrate-binding protein [Azorhizobium sp. AG788]BAF86774.1 ABC transporter substrate binding protein [Azorhizobium caulinodans ORS 571]
MWKQFFAALTIVGGLTGAVGAGAQAQTLRFGLMDDPDALDPTLSRNYTTRMVFAALCDKLVDIDAKLNIIPQLASEWSWSADQKTLTMKIRPGLTFHDGEKLDAEAVKFNLERHQKMPGSQRRSELAALDTVEVVDPVTVRLHLKAPSAPFLSQLTDRAGMMVSPKAAQALGDKFATAPVCAGPFKFVERVAQDHILLEKFDGYWNKDNIFLQKVDFRTIPDSTVRLTNLRSGQLDLLERLAPTDLPEVRSQGKLKVGTGYELGFQSIIFNTAKADSVIGGDARVRKAFELSIDREALSQVVFNGEYLPGNQWVSPKNPFYVSAFPIPKRDVAKAKALLKDAGVKTPVPVNLIVYSTNEAAQVGQVVQAMTKESGFEVKLVTTDIGTALNAADQGNFEAFLYAWSGRPDPDGNTYNFLACKAPLNYTRFCNEKAQAALDAERATSDPAARAAAWKNLAEVVLTEDPLIYLYHRKLMWAYTPKLKGFTEADYPDGLVRFTGLKLD